MVWMDISLIILLNISFMEIEDNVNLVDIIRFYNAPPPPPEANTSKKKQSFYGLRNKT